MENEDSSAVPVISKNALKRQIRREKIEANKETWKKIQKEKRKKRKQESVSESTKNPDRMPVITENINLKGRIFIDIGFIELMNEKELKSFCSQLMRCYALNRRFSYRFKLAVSDSSQERLNTIRFYMRDFDKWNLDVIDSLSEEANTSKVVYLTADSPNVLEHLEEDCAYVIGGLVDHNRFKSICYDKASKLNIATARLPILENINLQGSRVLTIVNVFEVLLQYLQSTDWKKALELSIPKRKLKQEQS